MSKAGQYIRDYFTFSKAQRNGSLLLFALLIVLILSYFLMPMFISPTLEKTTGFEEEIKNFDLSRKTGNHENPVRYPFDPNELNLEQWLALGLKPYQAGMIIKYRENGGKFLKKEDLKKIYSITEEDYVSLEPYISIREEQVPTTVTDANSTTVFEPFTFDPNILPSLDWEKLGLKQNQVRNIESYLSAGGKFVVKEDFKKIFSITDEDYDRLKNFIMLPAKDSLKKYITAGNEFIPAIVEINGADSAGLLKLKNVGPAFAGRISKYRNKLGGFYKKEQLMEVFGMDTTRYYGFIGQVELDPSLIRKINLNKAEFKELLNHPYLEYYLVKAIFDYKEKYGIFDSVAELKKVNLVYRELYEKISPYLYVGK